MITKNRFGRTGHESTRVLFGAAALGDATQEVADRTLDLLLKHGINHIDVAASYGEAELRVGPWMKQHRRDFFLATKTGERTRAKARDEIRRSLERLQTDQLDLIQLHAVLESQELETVLGPGGALEAAVEARDQGLVRFIGITSHSLSAPSILLRALAAFDFASVLLPYNYPMMRNPGYAEGFNRLAAACEQRGVAMQTIKSICRRPWPENAPRFATTWYEPLSDAADIGRAVAYTLGRPQNFLNSAGDVGVLPRVLEAAGLYSELPSEAEMQTLATAQAMVPLWEEHEAVQ